MASSPHGPPTRQWHGAPVPAGRCFGRDVALTEVLRLLDQPAGRLVTLTGMPGVGKTRLALALAEQAPTRLSCPVCWVSLAPLTSPNALADALLAAFDLPSARAEESLAALRRYVANLDVLLVLDNFEHLLPPTAPTDTAGRLLTELLGQASLSKCLVTSRAPLQIPGEWIYPVSPLIVPPEGGTGGEQTLSPDAVIRYPSVQLFVERARAADPVWQLTEANAAAVAAFCRDLDGLPLAIELTAAQVRALTVEEMLRQWEGSAEGRLALLEDPSARGLWRALGVWFARLSPAAQQLLADLSVCAGDFSRDAAEAIGGTLPGPLRELVETSWLQMTEAEGHSRYRMLETIHAFVGEQRGPLGDVAGRRHAEHFLQAAQSAAALWHTPRQAEALRTFTRDWPNLQRGFRWACERGEDPWVCPYARAVFDFLTHRGWYRERAAWGEAWLAAAERAGGTAPPEAGWSSRERCHALVACGEALRAVDETERSRALLQEGLAQARALDDPRCAGEALWSLAQHILREADRGAALDTTQESLACFRRAGDLAGQARALQCLASILPPTDAARLAADQERFELYRALGSMEGQVELLRHMAGENDRRGATTEACRLLEEATSLAEAAGMSSWAMRLQAQLGALCARMGDLQGAERWYRRCLQWAQRTGDASRRARSQDALAGVLLMRGEPDQAHPLLEASYQTLLHLDVPRFYGDVLMSMGEWARQKGDGAEAERLLLRGVEVHRARGNPDGTGAALWRLGEFYRKSQRHEEAAQVLEESLRFGRRTEVLLELGTAARGRGDLPAARRWWTEALQQPRGSSVIVSPIPWAHALVEIGGMAAAGGDRIGALLLAIAARELERVGVPEARVAVRDAEAARKALGRSSRAVRPQATRTTLEEAVAQARAWLEQEVGQAVSLPSGRSGPAASLSSIADRQANSLPHSLRVYLLGRFEVWREGEQLTLSAWRRPKVAALFKWLCLQGGRRVGREEVTDPLWGDLPVERAPRNLAMTLSTLRRALGAPASACLRVEGETLQLALGDTVWVDSAEFERHLAAAARCRREGDAEGAIHHCRAALALYQGDLLPDEPLTEWVLPERRRLAELRLRALVTLAEHALAQGDVVEADTLTQQALQQDPCEESAVRTRMEALAQQEKRTEALRCFEQFRRDLRRELHAEPEAETLALFHRLRLSSR